MSQELPTYDSMAACAGATGIPRSMIRKAKSAGCPAFRSNRVELGPLLRWLFEQGLGGEASLDDLKRRKLEAETRHIEIKAKRLDGSVIATDDAEAAGAIAIGALNRIFRQALCNDLPAATKGLDEAGIRAANEAALERAYEEARRVFKEEVEKAKQEAHEDNTVAG